MSFHLNNAQQMAINDSLLSLTERLNIFLYLTPYSNFSMIYLKLRTDVSPVIL